MSKKQILLDAEKLQIELDAEGFQNISDVLPFALDELSLAELEEMEAEAERENRDMWNSMQMQREFEEDLEHDQTLF